MNPKQHKNFRKGIAEKVEVHESVVDDFIDFYYDKVRQALSSLESNRIFIDGLGTFALRKVRVEKAIKKNKSYLGNLEKTTYKGYDKTIITQNKIKELENALSKIEKSIIDRKNFKNEKK